MAKCDEEDIRASADSQLLVQRYNITTNNMLCKDSQQQKKTLKRLNATSMAF